MRRDRALTGFAGSLFLSVSAIHAGQPHMSVDPTFLSFGPAQVGGTTPTDAVNIHNDPGGSDLFVSAVSLTDGETSDFVLSCDGGGEACLSGVVHPGQTKTVLVLFSPTATGPRSATLTIAGNDSLNPTDTVALDGVGIDFVFGNNFEPGNPDFWSSYVGAEDTDPPNQIDNFEAFSGIGPGSVDLSWTAPTEDTFGGGAVWGYEVRYSLSNIVDEPGWNAATSYPDPITPNAPAETENLTVYGLVPGSIYYFVIRARDEVGNQSPLSSSTSAEATP